MAAFIHFDLLQRVLLPSARLCLALTLRSRKSQARLRSGLMTRPSYRSACCTISAYDKSELLYNGAVNLDCVSCENSCVSPGARRLNKGDCHRARICSVRVQALVRHRWSFCWSVFPRVVLPLHSPLSSPLRREEISFHPSDKGRQKSSHALAPPMPEIPSSCATRTRQASRNRHAARGMSRESVDQTRSLGCRIKWR